MLQAIILLIYILTTVVSVCCYRAGDSLCPYPENQKDSSPDFPSLAVAVGTHHTKWAHYTEI